MPPIASSSPPPLTLPSPLFNLGPVRFYQSSSVPVPLVASERLPEEISYGLYLGPNERAFKSFYPVVGERGGVVLGVGSLQNLDLAAAVNASGLILVDRDPGVVLTLSLAMSRLPFHRTAASFMLEAVRLTLPGSNKKTFLQGVSDPYRPAFEDHVDNLRGAFKTVGDRWEKSLRESLSDPSSFLGNPEHYNRVAALASRGAISVVYGDIFGPEMPELIRGAMTFYREPIRVIYLSNALEYSVVNGRKGPSPLPEILTADHTDPEGHLLMTVERPQTNELRRLIKTKGPFLYHAPKIREAISLMRSCGNLSRFVDHFQREPGLPIP